MDKLNELYAKRQVFLDYGSAVPETLVAEIKDAQSAIFDTINSKFANIAP